MVHYGAEDSLQINFSNEDNMDKLKLQLSFHVQFGKKFVILAPPNLEMFYSRLLSFV